MIAGRDAVAAVLAEHVSNVGPISGAWFCPCGATSSNGHIGAGNLTTRAERTAEFIAHLADALAPLLAERAMRAFVAGWFAHAQNPKDAPLLVEDAWHAYRLIESADGGDES